MINNDFYNDKFTSYKTRFTHYYAFWVLIGVLSFSFISVLILGIFTSNFFFYFAAFMFIIVGFANLLVFSKRARFYISKFAANQEEISFTYYDKDNFNTISIKWSELDFCFGYVKGDQFLVIWKNKVQILKVYKSIANQTKILKELSTSILNHVPKERVKFKRVSLFTPEIPYAYTKDHFNAFN